MDLVGPDLASASLRRCSNLAGGAPETPWS